MNRAQKRRLLIVVGGLLGSAVLIRHLATRIQPPSEGALSAAHAALSSEAPAPDFLPDLPRPRQLDLLRSARAILEGAPDTAAPERSPRGDEVVFLSLYRPQATALVARGRGPDVDQALAAAAHGLARRAAPEDLRQGSLKIDVLAWEGPLERFDGEGESTLDRSLDGVSLLDADLQLLPEEILSRRLVNSSGDLQSRRLRRYLQEGGRPPRELRGNPGKAHSPFRRLRFISFSEAGPDQALALFRGNPEDPEVTPASLLAAARAGGDYLLRHQRGDGDFGYSYEPKKDSYNDSYNLLRHAGTCYALAELHRATGDPRYLRAAALGLEALLRRSRGPLPQHGKDTFLSIVSKGEEAKLGGAALTILAILEYQKAAHDSRWSETAEKLARFIVFQQDPDGHFRSKYFYGEPDPVPFESIYYPGEAILALTRLHAAHPDPLWLETARKGADWLIDVRDGAKSVAQLPHDHWLLMGLNELIQATGDERYSDHAAKIAQAIVGAQRTDSPNRDWIGSFYDPPRSTPTATRAEALVAMSRLALRSGIEPEPYLEALERMAEFQLRCQLTRQNSLYLPRPSRAEGGFRRSLTNWEVRIDYVQHNVSALLGLRKILQDLGTQGSPASP